MVENTIFWKKGKLSREEKLLAYFFSYHRAWQTSENPLSENTRFFEKYCASYMIISLWPNKSRTNFFKFKAIVPNKKILANSFWCYPLWQTSNNFLLCSMRLFGSFGVSYKTISLTPKSLLKTQFFEKKGKLFSEEKILANFISHFRV